MAPKIKICCIASVEEGLAVVEHGARAVGLVSQMPSGPGVIPEALIAEIAAALPPPVRTFLLTSRQDAAEIIGRSWSAPKRLSCRGIPDLRQRFC